MHAQNALLIMQKLTKERKIHMEEKLLKPKYDVVFNALSQGNKENITESLISDILGERVKIIEIKADESLIKEYPEEKLGRLDLKTKFQDGTICQIEIQLANEKNTIKRILYYWSKSYSTQLKRGQHYNELKKTIGIIITDYEIKELEEIEELETKWQIMETKRGKRILTEDLELRIIEIPKATRIIEKDSKNRIAQWMIFLDNPNTERVEKIMKENKDVKKARDILYVMSEDEKLQRLAFLKERAILDEQSALASAKEEVKKQIAKKMKEKQIPIEEIIEITGLEKEEIEKL